MIQVHKYPHLTLLFASFVAAYTLYHIGAFDWLGRELNGYGYVSIFLGGLLFSFGFTTPFGIAIFVEMAPHVDPFLAAIVAGCGAFLADLLIFDIIRTSTFHDEIHRLRSSRFILWLHSLIHHESVSEKFRRYLLWSFAGIVIASPLPDEFGVSLLSGMSRMKSRDFAVICYCFNTVGILLILLASRALR